MEDKPKFSTTYFDYHPPWLKQLIEADFPELARPKHRPPYYLDEEKPKQKISERDDEVLERGKVLFFNREKGFGFIKVKGRTKDVFAHIKDIMNEPKTLERGQSVEFVLVETAKGPEARNIEIIS